MSYLKYREVSDTGKTKVFTVLSNVSDTFLGHIKWYGPWRKYVFMPASSTLFDAFCLGEITEFIRNLMAERKAESLESK